MQRTITIIQGHPDAAAPHLCHALADAYAAGATAAGHRVERVEVARLEFPLLRSAADWNGGTVPSALANAQAAIGRASHVCVVFPLWTGTMPALLKGFFEQVFRPGFAFRPPPAGGPPQPALQGRSARLLVTMGMPPLATREEYLAHGVAVLDQGMFGMVGIGPTETTFIGGVGAPTFTATKALEQVRELGALGR